VEEKTKKQADYSAREAKAMKDFSSWLTSGNRSDDSILAKIERTKYLDRLATFRVLFSSFSSSIGGNEDELICNKILDHSKSLFAPLATTLGDQTVLVGALEELCSKSSDITLFTSLMRGLHRNGVLSSKYLRQWLTSSTQTSWLIKPTTAIEYRNHLKTFITSLR